MSRQFTSMPSRDDQGNVVTGTPVSGKSLLDPALAERVEEHRANSWKQEDAIRDMSHC